MTHRVLIVLAALALPCAIARLSADTLTLASGTRIAGTVVSVAQGTITFKDSTGVSRRYRAEDVIALEFTPAAGRRANATVLAIPSGALLKLRLLEMIDSSVAAPAQTYAAVLDEAVVDGETTLLPQGSSARVSIREIANRPGDAPSSIVLQLDVLSVAGRQYRLTAPAPAGSDQEGEPVKRRALSSDFSQPTSSGPPTIRLVSGSASVVIATLPADGGLPGFELVEKSHIRIQSGTTVTFTATGPVTLQASH